MKYPHLMKLAVSIRIPGRGLVSHLDALKNLGAHPFTTGLQRGAVSAEHAAVSAASRAEQAIKQKALRDAAQETFERMGGQWQPTNPGYGIEL
jgi:hypothetical protein